MKRVHCPLRSHPRFNMSSLQHKKASAFQGLLHILQFTLALFGSSSPGTGLPKPSSSASRHCLSLPSLISLNLLSLYLQNLSLFSFLIHSSGGSRPLCLKSSLSSRPFASCFFLVLARRFDRMQHQMMRASETIRRMMEIVRRTIALMPSFAPLYMAGW